MPLSFIVCHIFTSLSSYVICFLVREKGQEKRVKGERKRSTTGKESDLTGDQCTFV